MGRCYIVYTAVVMTMLSSCVMATDKVKVLSPESMEETLDHTLAVPARFGNFPFGDTVLTLFSVESHACDDDRLNAPKDTSIPYVYLVPRGKCTFVTKAKNVQAAGAKAIIIYNNNGGSAFYMDGDGSGSSVSIPALMVDQKHGTMWSEAAKNGISIVLSLEHYVEQREIVKYTFWTSAGDPSSLRLEKTFSRVSELLGAHVVFTPRFHFFLNDECETNADHCEMFCTNGGKYCGLPDDHFHLSGAQVVRQNVLQICLREALRATNQTQRWWQYAARFAAVCFKASDLNLHCSEDALRFVGLQDFVPAVQKCIDESGGFDAAVQNTVIEAELHALDRDGLYHEPLPALLINDEMFHGSFDCPSPVDVRSCPVLSSLCDSFKDEARPSVCFPTEGCALGQTRDVCNICHPVGSTKAIKDAQHCIQNSRGRMSGGIVALIVLLVVMSGALLAAYVVLHMKQRRLQHEVKGVTEQYQPLASA